MQQQKLCLKWNNHTGNLVSVLETFQQKDVLVDVTLSCEGHNIKAHRMVLSACSPYFQNIFLENPCQHPIVIINGMKYEDITAILNFMYKGEVNVSHEGLSSFLQAAEALKVKGLAEVCGEKKSTNSNSQENEQVEQARPQRTDTPTKKRHRNRKRSFSDSNRSDDEGAPRKHKEINSPEVHELSGDESYTGDMSSNGQHSNSLPRVPQNVYSRSHQSSSNLGGEEIEDEYEVEPSKLLEQTLTTESVSMNNSASSDNSLRIERIMGNANDMESSSLQEPESPPDIKPIIEYGESSAGAPEGSMLVYNEHSQPGPSNIQDGSLLHDNSHTQDIKTVLKKLALIRATQLKHSDMLHELLEKHRNTWIKQEELKEDYTFPVTCEDELVLLESYAVSPGGRGQLLKKLKELGGNTFADHTRRILKHLMTDDVAEEYSFNGSRGKKKFSALKICEIALDAVIEVEGKSRSRASIETVVKQWLRHAKERRVYSMNKTKKF